jgi:mRNA-degrading endonuclease toxin of MazEF toxin-antitoxin module
MSAKFRPFDVVAVAVGEGTEARRRPALIVSTPDFEKSTGLVWMAMITSAGHEKQYGDIIISDQAKAGLPTASVIRGAKLTTLPASKIQRRLGTLDDTDRVGARIALRAAAGFY